jgi:hypothetical protein
MENPNLNTFRRLGARIVGSAYVEGWGLYSEKLADEMGLFRNDGERFGMLDAVAWRAARLVVGHRASTRCTGTANGRSTSCSTRACRRPTRRSRPTATSAGRARPSPT